MLKTITLNVAKFWPTNQIIRQTIQKRNYVTAPKRFYKQTGVLYAGDGKYEITLDNRKLKTPQGTPLVVKSEPLAIALATEWDSQKDTINRSKMHLTALCNTAIDNPHRLQKEDNVNYILNFLPTDTVLYHTGEDEDLYKFQCEEWDPILAWFNERYGVNVQKTHDLVPPVISGENKMKITKHLLSYDEVAMHGFVFAVDVLKSLILALACCDRRIDAEKAVRLSRLEEEHQIRQWGRVEWAHDVSQLDSQARLAAAILFVHFNSTEYLIKEKLVL